MFLDDLSQEELRLLESIGTVKLYKKGSMVLEEGNVGSTFDIILKGRVEVRKRLGEGGGHKKLIDLGPGDMIGEVCFLGVECRSASVIALEDCQVAEFERQEFEVLVANRPRIGFVLYRGMARELAKRLAMINEELMDALIWALNKGSGPSTAEAVPDSSGRSRLKLSSQRGVADSRKTEVPLIDPDFKT